jgi:hypothetical protein
VEAYQPIMDRYTDAFLKLFPHADRHDVFWSIIFLESAMSSMLLETDLPTRVSKGEFRSGDLEPAIERMVTFFAAGFARLANRA